MLLSLVVAAAVGLAPEHPLADPHPADLLSTMSPPAGRVGRVSGISGKAEFRAADETRWAVAETNDPMATGFALRTGVAGRAQIEIGADTIDLSDASAVEIADLDDTRLRVVLKQGRIGAILPRTGAAETVEIGLAHGNGVELSRPGDYDIDAGGDGRPPRVTVFAGRARLADGGAALGIAAGEAVQYETAAPAPIAVTIRPAAGDAFAEWRRAHAADAARIAASVAGSPGLTGLAELASAGRWQSTAAYGGVWLPTAVEDGWAPYRHGHWRWIAPWGWTWIDDQPWGFLPSHYGRWVSLGRRWAWVPGAPGGQPVFMPAVVAFLGTPGVGLSYAGGSGPAIGWFPLAPGEAYWPSYTHDLAYIRELNRSALTDLGQIRLQPDGYPSEAADGRFANRLAASVVPRPVFLAGQPVAPALLELPPQRLLNAPVIMGSPRIAPTAPIAPQAIAVASIGRPRPPAAHGACAGADRGLAQDRADCDDAFAILSECRPRPRFSRSRGICRLASAAPPDRAQRGPSGAYRPWPRHPQERNRMTIDYRSDNTGRVAPQLLDALVRANHGTALGYGADEWTAALQERFSELFETRVRVFPVATGTAANALALAALGPSWGLVYCSEAAHINTSEANAAGFFGGGTKLVPVAGPFGKIASGALAEMLAALAPGQTHRGQPIAVSLTQASDLGAVYPIDEIGAIAAAAKRHGLRLHMDGARFANAVARLGCSPAALTWRSGIDIMSFGATKNGGALCDAIVVFAPELADGLAVQLRRAGQVWSKMRFASAQLLAYVEDGLWLDMAAAANATAAHIGAGIADMPGARLAAPVEANEIFLELPAAALDALEQDGFQFYRRGAALARFVCRFDASRAEADALLTALRRRLAPAAPSRAAE